MHPTEAADGLRRYEKSLDPRHLWANVTEQAFVTAMREVARVSTMLLPAGNTRAALADPIPGGETAFNVVAFVSGMGPLLGFWLETGRLDAPPAVATLLGAHLRHGRTRATRLRHELGAVLRRFQDVGIDAVVLKGMHTGWDYFPDPGTRPCTDLDVLIPAASATLAARLLSADFAEISAVASRSTWQRHGTGPTVSVTLTHEDNPWTLDLHRTLDRAIMSDASVQATFGPLDDTDLQPWDVEGVHARALAPPLLEGYLAVHASSHLPQLTMLRLAELALVLHRDRPVFAWERMVERLEVGTAVAFAYPALKLAEDLVPGTVPGEVLAGLRAVTPPVARRLVHRLQPATAVQMYRRSFEARFMWMGSWRQRLVGLLVWLWPRDGAGARLPAGEALAIVGRRLRRLATGGMGWRHR